jgi:hypothetical protein
VFGLFRRDTDDTKTYCNDAHPTLKTTRARFRIHKQIRDGDIPVLRSVCPPIPEPQYLATYKKGTTELWVPSRVSLFTEPRIDSPSMLLVDDSVDNREEDNWESFTSNRKRKRKNKKRKR